MFEECDIQHFKMELYLWYAEAWICYKPTLLLWKN
jgi:hypothetical protein